MGLFSLAYKIPLMEKALDFMGVDTERVKEIISDFANKVTEKMDAAKEDGQQGLGVAMSSAWEAAGDTAKELSEAAENGELSKSKDVTGHAKSEVSEHTDEYVESKKEDISAETDAEKTAERAAQAEAIAPSTESIAEQAMDYSQG